MKDLSITQEYMLCVMRDKGRISGFDTEKLICMVAAGLLELQMAECIQLEKKRVKVVGKLPEDKMYLMPLYHFIDQDRPVKVDKIIEEYNYSYSDKKMKDFMAAVGAVLSEKGLVTITESGMIGRRISYIPNQEAVATIIERIRAAFFGEEKITENMACLVTLLEKSRALKTYFTSEEQKKIRHKLKSTMVLEEEQIMKYMVEYIDNIIALMTVLTVLYC